MSSVDEWTGIHQTWILAYLAAVEPVRIRSGSEISSHTKLDASAFYNAVEPLVEQKRLLAFRGSDLPEFLLGYNEGKSAVHFITPEELDRAREEATREVGSDRETELLQAAERAAFEALKAEESIRWRELYEAEKARLGVSGG
jgi:hypothetical protein